MHFILLKGSPRLLSNRCAFDAGLYIFDFFKHAYYVYVQRISIVPYIMRIVSDFTEEKSARRINKGKMIPDTPYMSHTICQLPEIEMRALLRFRVFIHDNWHIDSLFRAISNKEISLLIER